MVSVTDGTPACFRTIVIYLLLAPRLIETLNFIGRLVQRYIFIPHLSSFIGHFNPLNPRLRGPAKLTLEVTRLSDTGGPEDAGALGTHDPLPDPIL